MQRDQSQAAHVSLSSSSRPSRILSMLTEIPVNDDTTVGFEWIDLIRMGSEEHSGCNYCCGRDLQTTPNAKGDLIYVPN